MKPWCEKACAVQRKAIDLLTRYGQPPLLLIIRLYMGNIFFSSGKLKLDTYLNDDWESTVYLFREVTPVPFLPPEIAAVMGTTVEVGASLLLVFGLFGRFAALALLGMTAVIEFSFQYNDPDYMTIPLHEMWALLLATILMFGPGRLSLDGLCKAMYCRKKHTQGIAL